MRRAPGRAVTIAFLCVAIASTPFLFLNLIQPRIGVLDADLTPTGLRVASVDSNTVTFKLILNAGNPSTAPISVPLLQFSVYLGDAYLGNGWTVSEVSVPANSQAEFGAFLTMSRTPGSPLFDLFQIFLDGSSADLKLQGNAFVGGVGVPFELSMALGGSSSGPSTGADSGSVDLATDFINYIQSNGVVLGDMFNVISLNATNFLLFLERYDINLFGILYFLQEGQEWWEGFERKTMPTFSGNWALSYMERPGVQAEINKILNNYTYNDTTLAGDLYKFLWDIDEAGSFNGTSYSRVDNALYQQDFLVNCSDTWVPFTLDQARKIAVQVGPKAWVQSFYSSYDTYQSVAGFLNMLASITGDTPYIANNSIDIQPSRNASNAYYDNLHENWTINGLDSLEEPSLNVNYIRLCFENTSATYPPRLDIEADGDNLTIYDANTYSEAEPESSLIARYNETGQLIWYNYAGWDAPQIPSRWKSPWFETDKILLKFDSNGVNTTSSWGFHINGIEVWTDAPFNEGPQGNFTPWTPMDTHPYNATHRQYFNPSVQPLWDAWQSFRKNNWSLTPPPSTLKSPEFASKGISTWSLLWWFQYHYDFRYLLELFNWDELALWQFLAVTLLGGQELQIKLMYGELPLPNGTLLKDVPGYPTMSPIHEQMDFKTGGPFSSMIQPLERVWIYEKNISGGIERKLVDYEARYGVPDAPNGAGGPYAADSAYMSQLLAQEPGWAPPSNDTSDAMFNLAMTQDSRDPNSVWQMMNRLQLDQLGYVMNDTTFWNTNPLDLIEVLQLMEDQSPSPGGLKTAQGGGGFSVISLLGDVDMMEFLNYAENHTESSLGDVLRSLQVSTYSMLTYIIENVVPSAEDAPVTFPLAAMAQNFVQGNSFLQGVILAVPCIALGNPKRSRRCKV